MTITKRHILRRRTVRLLPLLALAATSATGASLFDADGSVKFSVTKVTNTTNPGGTISGLDISGSFALDPESQFEKNGNAAGNHEFNPINLPATHSPGDGFSQTLHVSGNAIDGDIASYHFSRGEVQLTNNSSNEYVVAFSMDYDLAASATSLTSDGSDASVLLELEYAFADGVEDVVSLIADLDGPSASAKNTVNFSVTLPPGAAGKEFYTDLAVNGFATDVSAVPIPAAVWLLGSGILGFTSLGRVARRRPGRRH